MPELLLKLVIPPVMSGMAAIAGRHWGGKVGGALVALPLTSGCIAFFLAVDQGRSFAATAAAGSLAGTVGQAAFCVAYAVAARRWKWPLPLLVGFCGFAITAIPFGSVHAPIFLTSALVIGALAFASGLLARHLSGFSPADTSGSHIGLRVAVTTAAVLFITGISNLVGPWVSGLLATFPLLGAIMAGFAHRNHGPDAAIHVLHGFSLGLYSTCGFFIVIGVFIERLGIAESFSAATLTALVIQMSLFMLVRKPAQPGKSPS